jgi:hypothetical protein
LRNFFISVDAIGRRRDGRVFKAGGNRKFHKNHEMPFLRNFLSFALETKLPPSLCRGRRERRTNVALEASAVAVSISRNVITAKLVPPAPPKPS